MIDILGVIFIIYIIIELVKVFIKKENNNINNNINNINDIDNINKYNNYQSNGYLMTKTELLFYRELKKITEKLNLNIFPQVQLERIINVKDNNIADRNKIKSRSVDYCIVNNDNCKIVCCIELDDYTHNREKVKIIDNFKNELFKNVNIPLHRIKVNNYYNLEKIEQIIKDDM